MNLKDNEFSFLDQIISKLPSQVHHEILGGVENKDLKFPIHAFTIGPEEGDVPTLGLFGGVHGLEKVGAHVVLAYLNFLFEQLKWNTNLQELFKKVRLVSIPIVNPIGLYNNTRCNGNGVDLMRNAPINSQEKVTPLVGGHYISNKLPWYRGHKDQMEKESQVLCKYVEHKLLSNTYSMSIDFHSGFGLRDRLWYPYANTKKPFEEVTKVFKVQEVFNKTLPYHIYKIEPQSKHYTTHGDLWDYLYKQKLAQHPNSHFLPWTLEMGSWAWFKKNPLQIFSAHGLFNPMKTHRFERTMRRHFLMMNFFLNIINNPKEWT